MSEGEIGAALKRRRRGAGLTLEELGERSGVSAAMISEVERGRKNPTVKLAYQLARALGCSLTDLLEEGEATPVRVLRAERRRRLADRESGVVRHGVAGELLGPGLEMVWYEIPPGGSTGTMDANRAGLVEYGTVLAGELVFVLGRERFRLGARDVIAYEPRDAMEYRNEGATPCELLLFCDGRRAVTGG